MTRWNVTDSFSKSLHLPLIVESWLTRTNHEANSFASQINPSSPMGPTLFMLLGPYSPFTTWASLGSNPDIIPEHCMFAKMVHIWSEIIRLHLVFYKWGYIHFLFGPQEGHIIAWSDQHLYAIWGGTRVFTAKQRQTGVRAQVKIHESKKHTGTGKSSYEAKIPQGKATLMVQEVKLLNCSMTRLFLP